MWSLVGGGKRKASDGCDPSLASPPLEPPLPAMVNQSPRSTSSVSLIGIHSGGIEQPAYGGITLILHSSDTLRVLRGCQSEF